MPFVRDVEKDSFEVGDLSLMRPPSGPCEMVAIENYGSTTNIVKPVPRQSGRIRKVDESQRWSLREVPLYYVLIFHLRPN